MWWACDLDLKGLDPSLKWKLAHIKIFQNAVVEDKEREEKCGIKKKRLLEFSCDVSVCVSEEFAWDGINGTNIESVSGLSPHWHTHTHNHFPFSIPTPLSPLPFMLSCPLPLVPIPPPYNKLKWVLWCGGKDGRNIKEKGKERGQVQNKTGINKRSSENSKKHLQDITHGRR